MAKVKLYGKKEVRAAAYNRMAARYFLRLAEASQEGQFFTSQSSLLFSAFTHEAFLNTLGPKIISFWKELEYLRPTQKLTIITATLNYEPHFGKRPYQTLAALFEFRNTIDMVEMSKYNCTVWLCQSLSQAWLTQGQSTLNGWHIVPRRMPGMHLRT